MKKLLIAAVMFLALSAAAFAQSSFTVASTPETFVSCCGLTERTGDIAFTAVPGTPDSIAGTLTITYPVPITNAASTIGGPPNSNVFAIWKVGTIGGTPGVLPPGLGGVVQADGSVLVVPSVTNVEGKGTVVIGVPAGAIAPYSIRLTGVRVSVDGSCGSGPISASITSTGNLLTSGETGVVVISNITQALRNPVFGTTGVAPNQLTSAAAMINAVTGDVTYGPTGNLLVSISENFLDAFGEIAGAAGDPTATRSKQVRLTFSALPAGVTLTLPTTDASGKFTLTTAAGVPTTAATIPSSTGSLVAYYSLTTNSDPTMLESLTLNITVNVANTASFPLPSSSVTVSAHIAPIDAVGSTAVPRYSNSSLCETEKLTILAVQGASTTLLVPFATSVVGFDTGITVANTSLDPGTAVLGFPQAVRQTGTMTFYFYPQKGMGAPFTYTTAAGSPGTGLETNGSLAPGSTYVVLLSQLLTVAGAPADFNGYIFVTTNFTNAHGEYFVSDFDNFTHGALMLVVNRDGIGRENPESLDN